MRNIIKMCKGGVIWKMPTDILNIITRIKLWPISLKVLIICMLIDYITGIVVAGVFKKSKKSQGGAIESRVGFKGLCRKGSILLVILVGAQLDNLIGSEFIKNVVTVCYLSNEIISINENISLMGLDTVPIIELVAKMLKKNSNQITNEDVKKEEDKNE